MKPLGYRGLWKEMDSKDGSVNKHIKKYKRSERQKVKKELQDEQRNARTTKTSGRIEKESGRSGQDQ